VAGIVTPSAALSAAIKVMDREWKWGSADCCTAACEAFALLHGLDPMEAHRGTYDDERGAVALVARLGGWEALCASHADAAGLRECPPLLAPLGALGLARIGTRHSMTLKVGAASWAGKGRRGFILITAGVLRAWCR
jgi:hypothetical protein